MNRVFDRMKMHKVENSVDITDNSGFEKTCMQNTRQSQPKCLTEAGRDSKISAAVHGSEVLSGKGACDEAAF